MIADTDINFLMVDPTDNPSPDFVKVLAYWEELKGTNIAPSWKDFDLLKLPPRLVPHCIVVDLNPVDAALHYRYYGTAIAKLHGYELTHKTDRDIVPSGLRETVLEQYKLLQEHKKPLIFTAHFPFLAGRKTHQHILRLPLSDDGISISNALSVQDISDEGDTLTQYYTKAAKL